MCNAVLNASFSWGLSMPNIPVHPLLQHGGACGVRRDNAVLKGLALQHGQIQESKFTGPHANQGLDRWHYQPLNV